MILCDVAIADKCVKKPRYIVDTMRWLDKKVICRECLDMTIRCMA